MRVYVHPIIKHSDGTEQTVLGTQHVLVLYIKNVWHGRHNVLEQIKNLAKRMEDRNWNGQEYTGKFEVEVDAPWLSIQNRTFIVEYICWEDRKTVNYYSRDLFCVTRKDLVK